MSSTPSDPGSAALDTTQIAAAKGVLGLKRQESRYWYLLGAICIVTATGLAFAISPLLGGRIAEVWPWANTHVVLISLLPLSIALLVGYLTIQKQKTRDVRQNLEHMARDAVRRERQNAARLRALLNVSRMMGSVTNLESVFNSVTNTCLEVFDCQRASLMMVNEETRELETRAATGHANMERVRSATVKIGEGIAGWVAEQKTPIILTNETNLSQYPNLKLRDKTISAAMVVPILLRDELVGVLNVSSESPDTTYTPEDLQALQVFAESAGTCIRHTEHVEWMRKTIQEQASRAARQKATESINRE
jgi:transcriptional regulator with GAF, ATPase, and Fis domain